jgi:thioredoxin 2
VAADRATSGPKCGACANPIHLDRSLTVDDATFDRVIAETTLPVLVDFYADWCGPCRMMAPALEQLASSEVGRLVVAKLDTEAAQGTAARFQIRGLPTLILFRGGREASRASGARSLGQLKQFVGPLAT